MRRVFKTASFDRWMKKSGLTDMQLCTAVHEMEQGLIDAHLGGGVVKKRVAMAGRGKSGGARTLLATNLRHLWFFVFGFAKNDRANINPHELEALQDIATDLLALDTGQLDTAVTYKKLLEICHEH